MNVKTTTSYRDILVQHQATDGGGGGNSTQNNYAWKLFLGPLNNDKPIVFPMHISMGKQLSVFT